jgi:hypothetical protein
MVILITCIMLLVTDSQVSFDEESMKVVLNNKYLFKFILLTCCLSSYVCVCPRVCLFH